MDPDEYIATLTRDSSKDIVVYTDDDILPLVYTKNTNTPSAGAVLYNQTATDTKRRVNSFSNGILTVANPITITTPYETIRIPKGGTLKDYLTRTPGSNASGYYTYANTWSKPATTYYMKIYKYVYGNQIIDIENTTFDTDTTLSVLPNIPTLSSFEMVDTAANISTWQESSDIGAYPSIESYKGLNNVYKGYNIHVMKDQLTGGSSSVSYEANVDTSNATSSALESVDKLYVNNTLYITCTSPKGNRTWYFTITENEYNSFPTSGILKWTRDYGLPDPVITNGYIWTPSKRTALSEEGYGWDWTVSQVK